MHRSNPIIRKMIFQGSRIVHICENCKKLEVHYEGAWCAKCSKTMKPVGLWGWIKGIFRNNIKGEKTC